MTPLISACLFLALIGKAFGMAFDQNEAGQYRPALISGLAGLAVIVVAEAALSRTTIGSGVVMGGLLIALRLGLEIGFSVGMLCPDRPERSGEQSLTP